MKRLLLGLSLVSVPGAALNGLRPIGVSAASRALGGTGVASYHNVYEAIYKNPSLMGQSDLSYGEMEATFGMTYGSFTPRVKATYGDDQEYKKPQGASSAVFPSGMGLGQKYSESLSWGLGFYGGGGGADYSEAQSVYRAKSRTIAYTLAPGMSWNFNNGWSFGANVSISSVDTYASNESITKGTMVDTGGQDITFGSLWGLSYQDGSFSFGAIFQPKQVAFLEDARDIDEDGYDDNLLFAAVPTEIAIGASWKDRRWQLGADYRFLQWSDADFLSSVGWKDQHVLALGYQYGVNHGIRLGANISTDAVTDNFGEDGFGTSTVSDKPMINLAGDAFTSTSALGVTSRHYTMGSFHRISEDLKIESGLVYMDTGSLERAGSYKVPTGTKIYGWRSEFTAYTVQVEASYQW